LNVQKLFLVDGLGALVSALLLGIALPAVQEWIGMPTPVLYVLATIAVLFAVNAVSAHQFAGDRASQWLRVIMVANLLYCALTGSLVVLHFLELTAWGTAYFATEIAIILGLVLLERHVLRGLKREPQEDPTTA
jgi:hypothetical protein